MFIIINMINVEFIKNEIACVSFDTGKRSNLLSLDIIRQLTDIADELNHNKKLMAIILSGGHQNFSFGFRAEDILPLKFGQKPSSAWEMQSSVNLAEPLGTETLIFTNFGEIEIVSRMFTPEQVKSNDVLDFALNLDRTYLFDENSGLAI